MRLQVSDRPSPIFEEVAGLLVDPASGDAVTVQGGEFRVARDSRTIPVTDGIPNLFVPAELPPGTGISDVTDIVKSFYEETPFPNYDGFDSRESLATKARRGVFAALLDAQLPTTPSCSRRVVEPVSSATFWGCPGSAE